MKSPFSPTRQVDWDTLKARVRVLDVARDLLGPPQAEKGHNAWWCCPLHGERTPSFAVRTDENYWYCFGCGKGGDAAELVTEVRQCGFAEAIRYLAGDRTAPPGRSRAIPIPPPKPSKSDDNLNLPTQQAALDLMQASVERLWSPAGKAALKRLQDERGLSLDTIRSACLGWSDPIGSLKGRPRGYTIPWFVDGELVMLKIRQPPDVPPQYRYRQVYTDPARHVGIYPDPDVIRPGCPVVIAEGEFDALLLGQEIDHLGAVAITLGSASAKLTPEIRLALLPAAIWFIASDGDKAGDDFAERWPASARRIRPPEGSKDWTEVHAGGWNRIRYYMGQHLGQRTPWGVLEAQRWDVMPGFEDDLADPLAAIL